MEDVTWFACMKSTKYCTFMIGPKEDLILFTSALHKLLKSGNHSCHYILSFQNRNTRTAWLKFLGALASPPCYCLFQPHLWTQLLHPLLQTLYHKPVSTKALAFSNHNLSCTLEQFQQVENEFMKYYYTAHWVEDARQLEYIKQKLLCYHSKYTGNVLVGSIIYGTKQTSTKWCWRPLLQCGWRVKDMSLTDEWDSEENMATVRQWADTLMNGCKCRMAKSKENNVLKEMTALAVQMYMLVEQQKAKWWFSIRDHCWGAGNSRERKSDRKYAWLN